ncbi:histidine phosphatase family protein [Micromonospora sp. NBC_01813]|nr:histidine phosphatase family protein [Micromonospora sp. NBC_01813]
MTFGELIVVRHGQSTWNSERRWAGQADPPLTDLGRRQAVDLAQRCRGAEIGAAVTSDLSRARETGLIFAQALELDRPAEFPDLRERWSRTITGLAVEEIGVKFPGALAAWRDGTSTDLPGDSEPFDVFAARVLRGLQAATGLASVVLVVAHAGLFRVLGNAARTGTNARTANTDGRRIMMQCRSDRGVWAGQVRCGWGGVTGDPIGRAFDAVGVVAGAFDDAGAGPVAAGRVGLVADLGERVGQGLGKVLRG